MIIPIRCMTCSHVLADKWNYFQRRCKEIEEENKKKNEGKSPSPHFEDHFKNKIFEELQLEKYCCKRHLLGHVDLIDTI